MMVPKDGGVQHIDVLSAMDEEAIGLHDPFDEL